MICTNLYDARFYISSECSKNIDFLHLKTLNVCRLTCFKNYYEAPQKMVNVLSILKMSYSVLTKKKKMCYKKKKNEQEHWLHCTNSVFLHIFLNIFKHLNIHYQCIVKDTVICRLKVFIQHPMNYTLYIFSQWMTYTCIHIVFIHFVVCHRTTLKASQL